MKRPLVVAIVTALLCAQVATPTFGAKPPSTPVGGGDPPGDDVILLLTAEQAASRERKEALIARVNGGSGGEQGTQSSCPTPESTNLDMASGMEAEVTASCYTPSQWTLAARPRQQEKSYYCGPAVVQVVSNYSWRLTSTNKYSQTTISNTWTKTDATGQTYLADFIKGMNGASKRPSGFAYMQKSSPSFSNWHSTIVSGIYDWRMPLAAGVRPHEPGATYWIISWPVAKSAAHYIGIFGYQGFAASPNSSRKVYYTDTAGPYAAAGVNAGNFWDISYDVYQTMMMNNGNMVY